MRTPLLCCALLVAGIATGCDFTPTLDIPLPEPERAVAIQSILIADSTVSVFVGPTQDPYGRSVFSPSRFHLLADATVELMEDGKLVERLTVRPGNCTPYRDVPEISEACGAFVSQARVRVGGRYTIRVRADSYPEAYATVTVPGRARLAGAVQREGEIVSFTLRDPEGAGENYAIQFRPRRYRYEQNRSLQNPDGTYRGDTTVVIEGVGIPSFQTRDPLLVAAAGVVPDDYIRSAVFDDKGFDGMDHTFVVSAFAGWMAPELEADPGALWVIRLDSTLYSTYKATSAVLGGDNPFAEPANLPSNVIGGYGLVGAATVAEFELPEPSPAQRAGA